MTIQANHSLVIGNKAIYSNLLVNANISVIGYRDLSKSGNKLFRPQEIVVGYSSRGNGHISHLNWDPKVDNYHPIFYTAAPASVCDILPVIIDYEWPRKLITSCALVVAASHKDCGVWLVNFSKRGSSTRLIHEKQLRPYIKGDIFPRFNFAVDYDRKKISLLIHERFSLKKSTLVFDKDNRFLEDSKKLLGKIDLTQYLTNIDADIDLTLSNTLSFMTQYN